MIVNVLYSWAVAFAGVLIGLFPTGSGIGLNTLATSVVGDGIFTHAGWVNDYVPVDQLVAALVIVATVFATMLTVRLFIWVLGLLHVVGDGATGGAE